MTRSSHDWLNIDRYVLIQERCLEQVEEYFVGNHNVRLPVLVTPTDVEFRGVLQCLGDIEIFIDLRLDRDGADNVRNRRLTYHAQICIPRVLRILRYDNSEHYPDHPDAFHKHLFDPAGNPSGLQHIGRDHFRRYASSSTKCSSGGRPAVETLGTI